jgi:GNAT superfamily N-acetyltransferase
VIQYRTFRNTDPPHLAELWRSRRAERGIMQPMSLAVFDQFVLAKLYFEAAGLIVACADGVPVGYAHAGFGPGEPTWISHDVGILSWVLVRPDFRRRGIGRQLLARAEDYLRQRGARTIEAGGLYPRTPFYFGMYGSQPAGVLASDSEAQALLRSSGYQEAQRTQLMRRELTGFRPSMDRQQMQVRRQQIVNAAVDPPSASWWEASVLGEIERVQFSLLPRGGAECSASLVAWSSEPLSASYGTRVAGLLDLQVESCHRRRGLATCLLGESMRLLQGQGISAVDAVVTQDQLSYAALLQKFGFAAIDQGIVFRKE